jgi:hypothetical protein
MRRTISMAATALIAAALTTMMAGPASAEPAAGTAASGASAECGFFTYRVNETLLAAYRHCGPTTVEIHVDVPGQGSGNDYNYCSRPNETRNFGLAGNVLNAYYVGGAGCTP